MVLLAPPPIERVASHPPRSNFFLWKTHSRSQQHAGTCTYYCFLHAFLLSILCTCSMCAPAYGIIRSGLMKSCFSFRLGRMNTWTKVDCGMGYKHIFSWKLSGNLWLISIGGWNVFGVRVACIPLHGDTPGTLDISDIFKYLKWKPSICVPHLICYIINTTRSHL